MPDHQHPLFIAGVGASAGGLDALLKLVATLPDDERLAVVVAQHVSPTHESKMVELLSRNARWPVVTAKDQQTVRGKHVYVTPPDYEITVSQGVIELKKEQRTAHAVPSVDRFLTSLAGDQRERAIAIILSGTGKDGAEGVSVIRDHGGYVIAQSPEEAQHPGMPESAIRTGFVAEVLPVDKMGEALHTYVNHPSSADKGPFETSFQGVLRLMTEKMGTDFSMYKLSTIERRVDKRLEALSFSSTDAYYQYVQKNPDLEIPLLFETMLIGVTQFFRDPPTFEQLRQHVKEILSRKSTGAPLRIWSVGCATGEEPYTVAIIIAELLGDQADRYPVQIFATDIHEGALAAGRRGFYPQAVVEHLGPELLDKYFNAEEGGYEIKKRLRRWVLFSKHDISHDPPFVRLDLVLCRNLLIYFGNELQHRVIPVFHYALNPMGYLLLGKSENILQLSNLFSKVDSSHKIFKKRESVEPGDIRYTNYKKLNYSQSAPKKSAIRPQLTLQELTDQALAHTFEYPLLVVNESLDVVYIRGKLQPYVDLDEGALKTNALKIVRRELHLELRTTFAKAKRDAQRYRSNVIQFESFEQKHLVRIAVKPFRFQRKDEDYYLIIFEQIDALSYLLASPSESDAEGDENQVQRVIELEHELAVAKEHLQTFTEELETSNEELQAMNEELQSANEELKSSNEELVTSNEELQSANEELQTTNSELAVSNENLTEKEAELTHINKELAINRDRFQLALTNSPIVLFYQDTELRYTWQYNNHPDFKVEDVLGKSDYELLGDEYQKFIAVKDKVLTTGEPRRTVVTVNESSYDVAVEPIFRHQTVVGIKGVAIDITEQVQARQTIAQNEAIIRSLVNEWDTCVLAVDLDYQVLLGNPAQRQVFQDFFNQDLAPGQNVLELLKDYPDLQANTHAMFVRAFGGESVRMERYQSTRADRLGNPRYYDIDIMPIRKPDGEVLGGALLSREITQQVLSEQQMERIITRSANLIGDHFFKNLTEQITELFQVKYTYIGLIDHEANTVHTKALRINGKLIRNFSYLLQDVPCQAVANDSESRYVEHVSQQFPNDPKLQRWNAESYLGIPVLSPLSGEALAILVMIDTKPLRKVPNTEHVLRIFSLRAGAEIERMRADERLKEKEQQISNITNNVADVIFESVSPAQGDPYFRFVSRAVADIYEIEPAALLADARSAFSVIHPDDIAEFMRLNDEALRKDGGVFVFEGRVIGARSGATKWAYISAKTERQENGDLVWYGTITDVTTLKQTQQALKEAKDQAEKAARAKDDFLATMSHEIRTPLNAIVGLSGLLIDRNPRPEQLENLQALRFSSESLRALINDILDMSKLEAGKVTVEQVPFSLDSLLTSLQQAHQIHAREGYNELIVEQSPEVPSLVVGDPVKLGQVLNNLLSNALKFTKDGEVHLTVSLQEVREEMHTLLFSVQDTGVGIAADQLEQIFDKFTQADSSTQRHYGGTGLGLSITKMLLELMGSRIEVESKLNQGSRFYFSLSVKQVQSAASEPPSPTTAPVGALPTSLRLLIVEDVTINRMILQQYLNDRLGITADEAINGAEAVQRVAENSYDIILMDVRMPVMDGYEAARQIRAMDGERGNIPIIALTADTTETIRKTESVRFTDVVTKPFEPNDLFAKIAKFSRTDLTNQNEAPDENGSVPTVSSATVDFDTVEQQFGDPQKVATLCRIVTQTFAEHKATLGEAMRRRDAKQLDDMLHKLRTTFALLKLDSLRVHLEYCADLLADDAPADVIKQAQDRGLHLFDQIIEQAERRSLTVE